MSGPDHRIDEGRSAESELPSGTVTFLFSDVEGSTRLLEEHRQDMARALSRHHELLEQVVSEHQGVIFETVGDAVYGAFERATDATAAAVAVQLALSREAWGPIGRLACRLALHTGDVERRGDHYFGSALFRCARLQAIGYGEQTLVSAVTARLVADALPAGAALRDEGFHRLKDLADPEHVFVLTHPELRDAFPPLRSLDAHPNNLPLQLSSFVDRRDEMVDLARLLERSRLVTITGPGGMGKTRLALELAKQQTEHFADGVYFVDLSGLTGPELVIPTVAVTLGIQGAAGPSGEAGLMQHLAERQALLVLDSLEVVIEAATDVGRLLAAGPGVRVVATSRMPLRIGGEQEFELGPLGVDDSTDEKGSRVGAGVHLFVDRAREIDADFAPSRADLDAIATLCRRVDGMPLAIELAAARTRLFTPAQLDAQLRTTLSSLGSVRRDGPSRQRTLGAAIGWSVSGLPAMAAQLFNALGVFAGGFTLSSVAEVTGDSTDVIVSTLDDLIDRSLIRRLETSHGEPRFGMYSPIREFARERLGADLDGVADRHAEYFASLAEILQRPIRSGDAAAHTEVVAELDNFRSALAFDLASFNGERAARLASALWEHWASGAFTPIACKTEALVAG